MPENDLPHREMHWLAWRNITIHSSANRRDAGLPGYALLDTQLDHILAVQSACNKAGRWNEVRKLTWTLDIYLDLQGHWAERWKSADAGSLQLELVRTATMKLHS